VFDVLDARDRWGTPGYGSVLIYPWEVPIKEHRALWSQYFPNTWSVYRLWLGGDLLYVGFSTNPYRRLHEHAKDKHWWPFVQWGSAIAYNHEGDAVHAEQHAISTEGPLYNVKGKGLPCPACAL
jgi:predicted GIY-YIG superfamily endonuclease